MSDITTPHRQQLLGLSFDQLFTAKTIAASGSFREASKILCLTQPAISQRVQHIESVLGTAIFERHAGVGVTLTAAGRTFLEFCDRALRELDELAAGLSSAEDVDRGSTLAITAPSDSIQHFILRMLPVYRDRYPDRHVRLKQSGSRAETVRSMESGETDLAFYRMPSEPTLDTVAMMDERLFLVASPEHPILRIPTADRPLAMRRFSFATYSVDMRSRQLVERWALKAGIGLSIEFESKSLDVMREAAVHGSLCVLPGASVTDAIRDGRLVTVDIDGMPLPRATAIAVRTGTEPSQAARDFLDVLVELGRAVHDDTMPEIRLTGSGSAHLRSAPSLAAV
jgi:DNA-binding transcriptional LysR family regulator